LDGTDDKIQLPLFSALSKSADFTIFASLTKPVPVTGDFTLFGASQDTADRVGIQIRSANLKAGVYNGSSYIAASGDITSEDWQVAFSYNQITSKLYLNGALQVGTGSPFTAAGDGFAYIGDRAGGSTREYYDGPVSELRVSDIERSAAWEKVVNQGFIDNLLTFSDTETK
jgi:hypothetical protein